MQLMLTTVKLYQQCPIRRLFLISPFKHFKGKITHFKIQSIPQKANCSAIRNYCWLQINDEKFLLHYVILKKITIMLIHGQKYTPTLKDLLVTGQ